MTQDTSGPTTEELQALLDAAADVREALDALQFGLAGTTAGSCLNIAARKLKAIAPDLAAEVIRLRKELSAAIGYLTNAAIDLETGAPKKTALMTINGGIARARAAMEEKP